jgi:hypothetical protein
VQVAADAVGGDQLADEQRTPVAEPRRVVAELVPGIRLRDGRRRVGHGRAGEQRDALGGAQLRRVEAQLTGQGLVEQHQPCVRRRGGLPGQVEPVQVADEGVLERDLGGSGHGFQATDPHGRLPGRTAALHRDTVRW